MLIHGQRDGDMRRGLLPAGQVSGAIRDLVSVARFAPGVVAEAIALLENLRRRAVG